MSVVMVRTGELKKIRVKVISLPWYPFFLTLYAILFFLRLNISQVNLNVANRLLIIILGFTMVLVLLMRLITSSFLRAGMLSQVLLVIFFGYGHFLILLKKYLPVLARHRFLFPPAIAILIICFLIIFKLSKEKVLFYTKYLNAIFFILMMVPSVGIFLYESKLAEYQRKLESHIFGNGPSQELQVGNLPDVYFIVLDGYGRADALKTDFSLDNSDFIADLRGRGFYIADCSMSNYSQTELSFASTLNMEYLDNIIAGMPPGNLSQDYFAPYIKHGQVRTFLESLGYKTVAFYTGYDWAQWEDATYFLTGFSSESAAIHIIPFEAAFLKTTMLRFISDSLILLDYQPIAWLTSEIQFSSTSAVVFTLNQLPVAPQISSPKFVFAHIMLPHPPYLFGPDGKMRDLGIDNLDRADPRRLDLIRRGYRDQVAYANKRILPIIDSILSQSKGKAIIILEGDHGAPDSIDKQGRLENLSAYYFPDRSYSILYPTITPVNSFRVILTQYFEQNYPLLDDTSYFSAKSADRVFDIVPNTCNSK